MHNYGFIKVASASVGLRVGNVDYNANKIENIMRAAHSKGATILAFPELSITGYTCNDLFLQTHLLNKAKEAVFTLAQKTHDLDIFTVIGLPVLLDGKIYNCACAIQRGSLIGITPKMFLPNYKEFYEKRWFASGYEISKFLSEIRFGGQSVPFGNLLYCNEEHDVKIGIEVCEDLWAVIPPSSYLALNGANIIINPSASNELVAKADYRKKLIEQQSARCIAGYIYSGASVHESTTDMVFGSCCIIAENGTILKESQRFCRDDQIAYSDIDVDLLAAERRTNTSFADDYARNIAYQNYRVVEFSYSKKYVVTRGSIDRKIHPYPFVPADPTTVDKRCEEVFNIQTAGLAKRMEHTGLEKAIIAVSGGIDSTLALLVTAKTFDLIGIPRGNIQAITMPGFGTTSLTYNNAVELMHSLNVSIREIDIKPACLLHMKDIGQNPDVHDITYENIQARERMQILMNIANKEQGLVIGTGDLSELALGWVTYNGDHMSMYGVNSGVPKTLVKFLVKWVADHDSDDCSKQVLYKIIKTPISPELLPPDSEGRMVQKTEEQVGSFELHDFFLYHVIKWGMSPSKILYLAVTAFEGKYKEEYIKETLKKFYSRFFSQQFKRSALPDAPKVGSVCLSPRGDWRMPSDADGSMWIMDLD